MAQAMVEGSPAGKPCVANLRQIHLIPSELFTSLSNAGCEQVSTVDPFADRWINILARPSASGPHADLQTADILNGPRQVSKGLHPDSCTAATRASFEHDVDESGARAHSGNPAFRRPWINSFVCDCPPRAIHVDSVKLGSVSSNRTAAWRDSASRPR